MTNSKKSKKMPKTEVQREFVSLMNSCQEGFTGDWNCTGEGRDGFEAMQNGLKKLADHFDVNVKSAKTI